MCHTPPHPVYKTWIPPPQTVLSDMYNAVSAADICARNTGANLATYTAVILSHYEAHCTTC